MLTVFVIQSDLFTRDCCWLRMGRYEAHKKRIRSALVTSPTCSALANPVAEAICAGGLVRRKIWVRLTLMINDRVTQRIEEIDHVWVLSGVPHVGVWVRWPIFPVLIGVVALGEGMEAIDFGL